MKHYSCTFCTKPRKSPSAAHLGSHIISLGVVEGRHETSRQMTQVPLAAILSLVLVELVNQAGAIHSYTPVFGTVDEGAAGMSLDAAPAFRGRSRLSGAVRYGSSLL